MKEFERMVAEAKAANWQWLARSDRKRGFLVHLTDPSWCRLATDEMLRCLEFGKTLS